MKSIKKRLNSEQNKSIKQLLKGAMAAQLITIIVSPISTRLYTPEELGVYTLLLTIISMFGPVINGKYDLVIVSAKDKKELKELVVGSIIVSLILMILIALGFSFYLENSPEIKSEIGFWAYIIIILLFIAAFENIFISYNNRIKEYKTISSVYVIKTSIQNAGLVIFGLLKYGTIGLFISQLISSVISLKKSGENIQKDDFWRTKINLKEVRNTLIKFKNQPLYSMPSHFINSSSYSILNFFITGLFGMQVFGYYSMSFRILGLPLSLVSMNVSKVFYQKAVEEHKTSGNFKKSLKSISLVLIIISIPMTIVFLLFAPIMFDFMFGKGWSVAGTYVQILAPMYGIRFVVSALTPALIVAGKQKIELFVQSLFIISSIISYLICKSFSYEIEIFLSLISFSYSIIYLIFYYIIYKLSKNGI